MQPRAAITFLGWATNGTAAAQTQKSLKDFYSNIQPRLKLKKTLFSDWNIFYIFVFYFNMEQRPYISLHVV